MSSSQDLISLFQYHVKQQPTVIALQDESYTLTYIELDQWTNHLACDIQSRLKNTGGLSRTVAICMPRSVLFVVSVMAIVKSGCSYLPLDPSAPATRLDDQILQAGARLVITISSQQLPPLEQAVPFDIVPSIERIRVRDAESELAMSTSNVDLEKRSDILVIFFTSGSTGHPKGVLVRHDGILNMVRADLLSIQPEDHVSFTNNPAFDASLIDIWNTVCHGGSLFVLTAHLADMESLISFFREKAITKSFLVTAVFNQITNDAANVAAIGETIRMLAVGGEKLLPASVRALAQYAPNTRLVNAYGPSEASVFATTFEVPSDFPDNMTAIPIGYPIPETSIYLLDDDLRPVESGYPGEICIAGKGLAAGYLVQDELTSNKFVIVKNLDETGNSTRIYRSGDIGRFIPSPNGHGVVLEYIGRNDNQIKINGQRIELSEIEAALYSGSRGVGEEVQIYRAVVILVKDDILVAYVVPKDSKERSAAGPTKMFSLELTTKLLEYCQRNLPPYMVPRHIVIAADLPLTENGKVDRKKLAQPEMWANARKSVPKPQQPANGIQSRIQICVGEVLGEEPHKIPLATNFVALGLLSFRAPKLLNALRTQFSMPDLPFRVLHQYPSVKALSGHLKDRMSIITLPALNSVARREVPYDHDALHQVLEHRRFTMEDVEDVYETTWIQMMSMSGSLPHMFMVHQLVTARTDVDTFVKAIETVISRHTALRSTTFDKHQRQVVFRYNQRLRDQMIHIYPAADVDILENIVKDKSRYALTAPGPLITFEVFCTTPPTLLIISQHAVMDAWSKDCLFRDLDHIISGKSLPEPAPFRNYVDYYIAHAKNPELVAWHVNRIRDVETLVPFPPCDKTTFAISSHFGPHFMRLQHLPEVNLVSRKYNIKPSTLLKVAFALVKRHETKQDTVLLLQTEVCRSLPVKGITEICAATLNVAIDRVDFFPGSSVLDLLRTTQRNQDTMTDTCIVDRGAILSSLASFGKDMRSLVTCLYTFSQKGAAVYDSLQPGPSGAENHFGVEWTTFVDGDDVKVRVDHDPIFAERIPVYADQFFRAARWLVANIEAKSIVGLEF